MLNYCLHCYQMQTLQKASQYTCSYANSENVNFLLKLFRPLNIWLTVSLIYKGLDFGIIHLEKSYHT